jgi:hypothetical protein
MSVRFSCAFVGFDVFVVQCDPTGVEIRVIKKVPGTRAYGPARPRIGLNSFT